MKVLFGGIKQHRTVSCSLMEKRVRINNFNFANNNVENGDAVLAIYVQ